MENRLAVDNQTRSDSADTLVQTKPDSQLFALNRRWFNRGLERTDMFGKLLRHQSA